MPMAQAEGGADQRDAEEQQRTGAAVMASRPQRRDQGEDAIDQSVGPEYQDQHRGGYPRPDERNHGEDDREHAADCQGPPIADQNLRHSGAPRLGPLAYYAQRFALISRNCRDGGWAYLSP